jgi:hypothetical protein
MIANIHSNDKPSRGRLENSGACLALAFSAGIFLLLTFLVPIGKLSILNCPFLNITGLPCPFCGLTRSIWAISAGDWIYATINYPLAWLIYTVVAIVFARSIGGLIRGIRRTKPFIWSPTHNQVNQAAAIITTLVLLNWVYRIGFGLS